jgi:hypothetical protein
MTALVPFLVVGIAEDDTIGAGKNIVAGASLNIVKVGGGAASIYSDEAGTTPITLPTTLDSSGQKMIFIPAGAYDIIIGGVSRRQDIIGAASVPIVVDTFADLASTHLSIGQVVYLKQHTSGGKGGGEFIGVSSSGLTPDTGVISTTNTGGVYAKRKLDRSICAFDFGAIGDESQMESEYINDAISYLNSIGGGTIYIFDGDYLIDDTITLYDNIELVFSKKAVLKQAQDDVIFFNTSPHAYFCSIRSPRIDGNGFDGGLAFNLVNFRLNSGIYDAYITDIEYGIYLIDGCFGATIENFTSYNGCPNPIVAIGNAATAVINNPNLDNTTGRWAGTGYGVHIQNAGTPNEGVIINGGYAQGYVRGVWDQGRGTRISGTYFEQCTEADIYFSGAIQSTIYGTQHFASIGSAAFKARETDGCCVISPNMGSGGRTVLYDVDSTNLNFSEYRSGSSTFDNTPTGSLTYISSIAKQTKYAFTPIISGGTSAGTYTPIVASGTAVVIGENVHVEIAIQWSEHTGTGAILVSGIPTALTPVSFTPKRIGQIAVEGIAVSGPMSYCTFTGTLTEIRVVSVDAVGNASLVAIASSGAIFINMTYAI